MVVLPSIPSANGEMRNATWRSHVVRPGRPCMSCNGQLDLGSVAIERQGLLDDPDYIRNAGGSRIPAGQNVAALSINVVASILAQYVSFSVAPSGLGEPGPLQYIFSAHDLQHLSTTTSPHCTIEAAEAGGDHRACLTGVHKVAKRQRQLSMTVGGSIRLLRWVDDHAHKDHEVVGPPHRMKTGSVRTPARSYNIEQRVSNDPTVCPPSLVCDT